MTGDSTAGRSAPVRGRKVSVALATYNGARFLEEQLDSFLAQTRLPDELVVGDDNSSDETLAILQDFGRRAPFPVYIEVNRPNLGPTLNFASAVLRCSGDVIFLSDQDDIWLPTKVETMLAHLAANPRRLLAAHDAVLVDVDGKPLGRTLGGQIEAAGGLASRDLVAGCCMAIDARLARLFDPLPHIRNHDAWLASAGDLLEVRSYVPQPLIDYRRHGANVSQSYMSAERKASRWHRFKDRTVKAANEDVRTSLEIAVADRQALVAALQCHCSALAPVVGEATVKRAVEHIEMRLAADHRRLAIHRAALARRPGLLLKSAVSGDYSGFDGALSLLRDIAGGLSRRKVK